MRQLKNDLPAWYDQLREKYPVVTLDEWQLLHSMASVKHIKKGEPLLRYGYIARHAAFIISGTFKFSILDEEGEEKIVKFGFQNDFLANCESYNKKAASAISIVAIEDAVVLRINIKRIQPLYSLHINLFRVNIQLIEELMAQQSEHQQILSLRSPLQRYKFLMENRPLIIQKISLTNIARYLYTSREALSRAKLFLHKRPQSL
ncbi:Crp/Fnr family transcriptional regulator [Mucilaginibacter dorajii]|uniref:Cyclic nucleotide-binding domain-containing protein n=1 Tax=Mucilaginibacter dorajii TaxID=692994 RepID=A0ABP7PGA3_9SPHI|nr:Crp/Fnr family transcriptional regulator [Mucilaginibacter dorajii]MCS3735375.1 CRP-like cAMP-binding protein [Mucilaginibacter dorajii]